MAYTIPSIEPVSARAGDTWTWTKTLSDFPATTWTLTYTLFNSAGKISITADADGSDYSVDVAPATTANYTEGRYSWVARVTDGTDMHQVGAGQIDILQDLSKVATYDNRTFNRKMLDALDALMLGQATAEQIHVISVSHNARTLQKDPEKLMKLRQQFAAAVRAEEDALRVARGEKSNKFMQVSFRG